MNVLVTGSNGQLGSEIKNIAGLYKSINFIFPNSTELDISELDSVLRFFDANKVEVVLNCAAYTNVDMAEKQSELAYKINSKGVQNLVLGVKKVNGKLLHISTDYVFDGLSDTPYKESDKINPIGVYGKTKREGELMILNSNIDAIIIRTSWLYSVYGNNFVKTILKLGKEKNKLKIVSDQIGSPTSANDLANVCLEIVSKHKNKIDDNCNIYHFSNQGEISWFDFGVAVIELGNIECEVCPVDTEDFPTLANRPNYSVLNKTKIKNDFNIKIPYWKDSLKRCIIKLNQYK